jgi:hypothetical protein
MGYALTVFVDSFKNSMGSFCQNCTSVGFPLTIPIPVNCTSVRFSLTMSAAQNCSRVGIPLTVILGGESPKGRLLRSRRLLGLGEVTTPNAVNRVYPVIPESQGNNPIIVRFRHRNRIRIKSYRVNDNT